MEQRRADVTSRAVCGESTASITTLLQSTISRVISNAIISNIFFHGKSQCISVVELSTNSPSDEPHTIAVLQENGDFPVVPLSDSETPLYDQYRIPMLQNTG